MGDYTMKDYPFAKLVVRGFPTMNDLRNPYIFTKDIKVVINVSEHKYPKEVSDEFTSRGIRYCHFPLVEEGPDMGLENILAAIEELAAADKAGEKVLLHCMCGNNRSRTVAEAFYFVKCGSQFEDEYKDYRNHIIYNCVNGHLPQIQEMESILSKLRAKLNYSN